MLVFDSEHDLYTCFEYLEELGDENFDDFEKAIGFSSYRSCFKFDSDKLSLFDDDLYKTLLNPERKIVVGGFILQDDPKEDKIYATEIVDGCLKTSSSPSFTVNRDQDIFSAIKGEVLLKSTSGCGGLPPRVFTINYKSYEIDCKMWYISGITKALKASMSRNWGFWGGYPMLIQTADYVNSWWRGSSSSSCDVHASDESSGLYVDIRIPTSKLEAFSLTCDFCIGDEGGQPALECFYGNFPCQEEIGCR